MQSPLARGSAATLCLSQRGLAWWQPSEPRDKIIMSTLFIPLVCKFLSLACIYLFILVLEIIVALVTSQLVQLASYLLACVAQKQILSGLFGLSSLVSHIAQFVQLCNLSSLVWLVQPCQRNLLVAQALCALYTSMCVSSLVLKYQWLRFV